MSPAVVKVLLAIFGGVRVIVIILDILLLGVFFYALYRVWPYRPKLRPGDEPGGHAHQKKESHGAPKKDVQTLDEQILKEQWNEVIKRYHTATPEALKLAVIEADKVADTVLKRMGLGGEHMADRLEKVSPDDFETVKRLWRAHRLRNEVVHTPGFTLSREDAKRTLQDYEAFLKEVKII